MRVATKTGIIVDGVLKEVTSEQSVSYPHVVIAMSVAGISDPVTVTLDELDLSTIVRRARDSTVRRIQDAVR
jgi:hypothetical protein